MDEREGIRATIERYRHWKFRLKALFDEAGEEYPDEERMAILFDRPLTPMQARDLILRERSGG